MLKLCWRYRRRSAAILFLQVSLTVFALLGLNFVGVGIDALAHSLDPSREPPRWPLGMQPPEAWGPMQVAQFVSAAIVAAALARGVLANLATTSMAKLAHGSIVPDLQMRVFSKLQELSVGFFSSHPSGSMINRATGDVQAIRLFIESALIEGLVLAINTAVFATYMFAIHPKLALACLATIPAMGVAAASFSRVTRPLFLEARERFDRMILYVSESIRGMETIKGYANERLARSRMREANDAMLRQQRRIFWKISLFSPAINFLTHVNLFILLIYGGKLAIEGAIPLGTGLVVFAGLLQQFSNQVSNVAGIANAVQESLTGSRRLREILDTEPTVASPKNPRFPEVFRGEIVFENVSVDYGRGNVALDEVSLDIQPGRRVALVGETGSGKSTLLSLVPRLRDPDRGRALISGQDARDYDLQKLRRQIGVVYQDSFLFNATVADNIRFGHEEVGQEAVERAARIACAHDFIEELDHGYDTVIGELGVDLSGGQCQRIAIARAILADPPILLLDDPTSAIDASTERVILDAVDRAIANRTTLIVAHRLSTLLNAHEIVVLSKGRVIQRGPHEELVAQEGPYLEAARQQMLDEASRRFLERARRGPKTHEAPWA